jgi:Mn-dependent DtxR family transcriptional regulator
MEKLSVANEDYLEAILELSKISGDVVRSVDIASKMGVSKASVNKAVNNLQKLGYVEKPFYGSVALTNTGKDYGQDVLTRHETIFAFLTQELGVPEEVAAEEACKMEHAMSEDTLTRLKRYLKSN